MGLFSPGLATSSTSQLHETSSPQPAQALTAHGVIQALERELAAERQERREEVNFLTKMHEREMELLKARMQALVDKHEEERRNWDGESRALVLRATEAEEKLRRMEGQAQDMEDQDHRRINDLEEARAALHRAESAALEADRCREQQCRAERELVQHDLDARNAAVLKSEQEAQSAVEASRQEEAAVRRNAEELLSQFRWVEQNLWQTRQQESQALAHAQSSSIRWECKHQEVSYRLSELEARQDAERHQTQLTRSSDELALESAKGALRGQLLEQEAQAAFVRERDRNEFLHEQEAVRSSRDALAKELATVQQEMQSARLLHDRADQALERQLKEARNLVEQVTESKQELESRRHQEAAQAEEAAAKHRFELERLRSEVDALKHSGTQEVQEYLCRREQDAELREARNEGLMEELRRLSSQVRDLEGARSEDEVTRVKLQTAAIAAEKEKAHHDVTLQCLRSEVETWESRFKQTQVENAERLRAALAEQRSEMLLERAEEKTRTDVRLVTEEDAVSRIRLEVAELERAKALVERSELQMQSEVRELSSLCAMNQQRATDVENSMRLHLDAIDREMGQILQQKQAIAEFQPRFDAIQLQSLLEQRSGEGGVFQRAWSPSRGAGGSLDDAFTPTTAARAAMAATDAGTAQQQMGFNAPVRLSFNPMHADSIAGHGDPLAPMPGSPPRSAGLAPFGQAAGLSPVTASGAADPLLPRAAEASRLRSPAPGYSMALGQGSCSPAQPWAHRRSDISAITESTLMAGAAQLPLSGGSSAVLG